MANLDRIRKTSRRFEVICLVLIVLLPLLAVIYWTLFDHFPPHMQAMLHAEAASEAYPLTALNRLAALVVTLLPISAVVYGLTVMIRLLRLYQQGHIFSAPNVACFRDLGRAMILLAGAGFLSVPLYGLALTFNRPPGQSLLTIGLSSDHLMTLFLGGVLLLISWVMDEGRQLAEDNALIV